MVELLKKLSKLKRQDEEDSQNDPFCPVMYHGVYYLNLHFPSNGSRKVFTIFCYRETLVDVYYLSTCIRFPHCGGGDMGRLSMACQR